jgi:hypothetical protein
MPDCKTCKENRQNVEPVPYIVHESAMARQERTIKRLWILLILVISLLVATNGAWIWYESQWEVVETEITQENDGGYNNYIGNDGDIYNGETNG